MGIDAISGEVSIDDLIDASAADFRAALRAAKSVNEYGPYVTLHDEVDYEQCAALFLLKDHTAGVAVEADGNIISVFNDQTHRHVLPILLTKAVEAGGCKLDCYATAANSPDKDLRLMYMVRGFVPLTRTKFVRDYAPDDWSFEKFGEPDIYFFAYNPKHPSPMVTANPNLDHNKVFEAASYEKASLLRDRIMHIVYLQNK